MSRPRYAFLGPEGTFTEAALRLMVSPDAADYIAVVDVPAALAAVRSGDADFAVVAIENTVEGGVTATLDTLAEGSPLVILGEVVLPVSFELVAVNLDQKQPGFPAHILPAYLTGLGVPHHIVTEDTYSIVTRVIEPGKTMCGLCSRLRRGILYRVADELGATKIALGHHRDDIVETLFLNLFHHAKVSAMPPKLRSDDGKHVVIRPLAYCAEEDIAAYAEVCAFPTMPCNLCGSQETLQRKAIKAMLQDWDRCTPGRVENVFRALQDVRPSHLADSKLFDFAALGARAGTERAAAKWSLEEQA